VLRGAGEAAVCIGNVWGVTDAWVRGDFGVDDCENMTLTHESCSSCNLYNDISFAVPQLVPVILRRAPVEISILFWTLDR
jgi:hypothetical protein